MPYKVKLVDGPSDGEVVIVDELRPIDVALERGPLDSSHRRPTKPLAIRMAHYGWPERSRPGGVDLFAFYQGET